MAELTSFELFKIRLRGVLYALAYFTAHHGLLGIRLSSWLKFIPIVFTLAAWIGRWPVYWLLIGLLWSTAVQVFYWYAKRKGYIGFLIVDDLAHHARGEPLADNQKVKILATGTFSVTHREAYVLQRPAEYWRVPVGDHAIMVQHMPGKYLYQFVQAGALQSVKAGYLIFGRRPQKALAITFLTTWRPESAQFTPRQFMSGSNHTPSKLERTIYLTFPDGDKRHSVHKNLLRDAGKPLYKSI
ncbi:MAG: hypothetical protein WAM60_13865 [Candidatus Promineifilaceae bacterium]